jgi:hypothetical protein
MEYRGDSIAIGRRHFYSTLCVAYLVCLYLYTALEQQPALSSTNRAVTRGMAEGATARTVHYLLSYTSCHRRGSVFTLQVALGFKSAKDLSFGRREGFLARYERVNALPPRPRVGRARVCPFFPVSTALAAVAPPKGRQLGAECRHEGRRRVSTPSFSRTRPPKGDLCGTWSVHA